MPSFSFQAIAFTVKSRRERSSVSSREKLTLSGWRLSRYSPSTRKVVISTGWVFSSSSKRTVTVPCASPVPVEWLLAENAVADGSADGVRFVARFVQRAYAVFNVVRASHGSVSFRWNVKLEFIGLFSLLQRRRGTARGGWGEHHLVCANGFLIKQKPWFLSNFFYFNNEMLLRKTIVCINRVLLIHHQRWSPFPAGEGTDKPKFEYFAVKIGDHSNISHWFRLPGQGNNTILTALRAAWKREMESHHP